MKRNILTLCMSLVMLMFASAAFAQSSCTKKAKADCPVTKCCTKADCTDPANCPVMTTEATATTMTSTSANAAKDAKSPTSCMKKCTKPAATEALAKAKQTKETTALASTAPTAKKD